MRNHEEHDEIEGHEEQAKTFFFVIFDSLRAFVAKGE
jgi:hypothetical protein